MLLQDAARVHTDLAIKIRKIRSSTHHSAGLMKSIAIARI
jgi:hypothetical protein